MNKSESTFNEAVFEENSYLGGHAVDALKNIGSFNSLEEKRAFIDRAFAITTMLECMRKDGVVVTMKNKAGRVVSFETEDGKKIDFYTNLLGPAS
jgi:hypothetical protein